MLAKPDTETAYPDFHIYIFTKQVYPALIGRTLESHGKGDTDDVIQLKLEFQDTKDYKTPHFVCTGYNKYKHSF